MQVDTEISSLLQQFIILHLIFQCQHVLEVLVYKTPLLLSPLVLQ